MRYISDKIQNLNRGQVREESYFLSQDKSYSADAFLSANITPLSE
jgi:hypothetical protein